MSEKKKKSNGLPSHADWNLDADDKFLRRYKRLVRSAPAAALQRMANYLQAILEESAFPVTQGQAIAGAAVPPPHISRNGVATEF
jgi:hypothetical protein